MSEIDKHPAFNALRRLTPARLRLDPEGGPATLESVLDFQLSHAKARDAIWKPVDWEAVEASIGGAEVIRVHSRAEDRGVYIRRPDLGRRLREGDADTLPEGPFDAVIVLADGLSADAVNTNSAEVMTGLVGAFSDLKLGPIVLAEQGRVGIGDEIGERMGAKLVVMVIGERPGLSLTTSLGAYLTINPRVGTPDSSRNCVSNIHDSGGLSAEKAVAKIDWLVRHALKLGVTGVGLKDNSDKILIE